MDLFDLFAKISLDTSEYDEGLRGASEKTHTAFDGIRTAGEGLKSVGSTLTSSVTMPILEFGRYTLETASTFQAGMSEVQAISGATGAELELLKEHGLDLAAQTKFSTAEVADAYKYMGMAGWDAGQMIDGLSGIIYLAGASGEELAATSDIVTDALTAFGLQAKGAGHFADVLAAASTNANTNVGMLGDSFQYVAPLAGAMNYSIEDVAVALGLMANSGVKAGSAGAQLRNIISNMANPTDTMAAAMEALGISLVDNEGNMNSLMEVMVQLRTGFGGGAIDSKEFSAAMNDLQKQLEEGQITTEEYDAAVTELTTAMYGAEGAQKAQYAAALAGKEGMAGLLAIVGASPADFEKMTSAVYNSKDAAEEMYTIMNDNAKGAVTQLFSAIDVLAESLGEFLIPAFTGVVKGITGVVQWFNSLDDGTKQVILGVLGVVAVIGPLLSGLGSIMTGAAAVGTAISGLGTVFSFLASPVGLIVAAVAALAGGFIYLWNTSEGFREFWIGLWDNLVGAVSAAWEGITGFFSGIGNAVSDFWGWLTGSEKEALDTMESDVNGTWDSLESSTAETWGNMETSLGGSLDGMVAAAGSATGEIGGSVDAAWTSAAASTQSNWGGMESQVTGALGSMSSVTQTATAAMGGAIDQTWTSAAASTELNWLGMESRVSGSVEGMAFAAEGAGADIYSSLDSAWTNASASTNLNWEQMVTTTGVKSNEAVTAVDANFSRMEGAVMGSLSRAQSSANGMDWTTVGVNIVDGMSYGVRQRAQELAGTVANAALSALNAAKAALDINSPSKKSEWLFEMVMRGGVVGVEKNAHLLTGAMEDVSEGLLDAMQPDGTFEYRYPAPQARAWTGGKGSLEAGGRSRGGDTYNFYSPKALDPVSAAREMARARQRLALGVV